MMSTNDKPNCFEKTEAGGAFFIFHQITDELSTKHDPACVQLKVSRIRRIAGCRETTVWRINSATTDPRHPKHCHQTP